jgi:hypothetical protein
MIDRTHRIKQTAEVFTPPELVNEMLDKLPDDVWIESKTFCDPACGNGNMLVEVLKRKLEKGHDPLNALKSIYGTDIMKDNIDECRIRLLNIVKENCELTPEHVRAALVNIRVTPLSKYKNGSLDYDFEFEDHIHNESILIDLANLLNKKNT